MIEKSLETNRLIIKRTKKEDTSFCIDMWLDDEMGKYLSDPPRNAAGDIYLKWRDNIEIYGGCYYFVAVSKENGEYIGACSAVPSEDRKHWDLGYSVHKKYWRQGYATEIIRELINFCYINGGRKITADVAKLNIGSNSVLRKLNFYIEKEGTFKKSGTDIIYENYTYRLDLK
ncbi:Acetyltransferase (GNAT) domain-containing protein [Clostridium collagenovorans DSM 3089]|uniref:Acetyltransferase (GNAT) domain-containing protein n=1 Tax=Clostridium collagenovorans DSM 3089 TaxID=1121306 RepID=A0A1M5S847_9CLOT|nr:GNAT family N-acetyltransferase [Clostridium collagenovorans]SHH34615.1 Acetyltransferase (GNAT) domain-containing protein [Clostridium collagenovorans DSM 3089]